MSNQWPGGQLWHDESGWVQQGSPLFGNGNGQGYSVSLSDDNNTLAVGAPFDDNEIGATWIYKRTNGTVWSEVQKIIAIDNIGQSRQGYSVALSGDGNTLAIGGPNDNNGIGAVWIYEKDGSTWNQVTKLSSDGLNQGFYVKFRAALLFIYSDCHTLVYLKKDGLWNLVDESDCLQCDDIPIYYNVIVKNDITVVGTSTGRGCVKVYVKYV